MQYMLLIYDVESDAGDREGLLLRRLERAEEAAAAYRRALELATNPVERRFLEGRLESLA